ncbi:hypothetical protein, partial [Klebsiella pneumoniae]|uniref:hypothetical protein n=1 Tax=Klebsiella pneumoniae TaxID=573 RepID=UPI0023EC4558
LASAGVDCGFCSSVMSFCSQPWARKYGSQRTWRGCLKTAKGRIVPIQPLVLFSMCFVEALREVPRQMRIGMTTYLKVSSSGRVMSALELESPRL